MNEPLSIEVIALSHRSSFHPFPACHSHSLQRQNSTTRDRGPPASSSAEISDSGGLTEAQEEEKQKKTGHDTLKTLYIWIAKLKATGRPGAP